MTDAERTKLNGIASEANNYSHPASHPASMIEESTTRKFMTDAEKTLLSSLGTKAAQIKEQNLGQNGYRKYEDGLLIQWGYMSPNSMNSTTGEQYVFLSTSFYNDTYTVITTVISSYTSPIVKEIVRKYTSYFITKSIQYGSIAGESYGWFAIGRWKL